MQHNGWDHGLKVTDDGAGLAGHCDGVLRKLADQCGLTAALEAALARAGTFPQLSRGVVVVSMAVAIALGATGMSAIAVLAQLAPVLGAAPSGSTVRRALGLADTRTLARIARARARIRAHLASQSGQRQRSRSLGQMLDWLEGQSSASWQERWPPRAPGRPAAAGGRTPSRGSPRRACSRPATAKAAVWAPGCSC
jgi:hypothetical protein